VYKHYQIDAGEVSDAIFIIVILSVRGYHIPRQIAGATVREISTTILHWAA